MDISAFSAIQTIKYSLKSRNVKSVECFKRDDILQTPVDPALVSSLGNSVSKYKLATKKNRKLKEKQRAEMDLKLTAITAKSKAIAFRKKAIKKSSRRSCLKSVKRH